MMTDSQFAKSFSQMIIALTVLTILLIVLGAVIGSSMDDKLRAQTEEYTQRVIAQRTQPVGTLNVGEVAATTATMSMSSTESVQVAATGSGGSGESTMAAATDTAEHPGKAIYGRACYICHDVGLTGSPKPGDVENWTPRIAKGIEVLYDGAINGFQGQRGIMPPKGGNSLLTDDEVKAAVDYLVGLVQ